MRPQISWSRRSSRSKRVLIIPSRSFNRFMVVVRVTREFTSSTTRSTPGSCGAARPSSSIRRLRRWIFSRSAQECIDARDPGRLCRRKKIRDCRQGDGLFSAAFRRDRCRRRSGSFRAWLGLDPGIQYSARACASLRGLFPREARRVSRALRKQAEGISKLIG